jgi:hypothetical protein
MLKVGYKLSYKLIINVKNGGQKWSKLEGVKVELKIE